MSDYQYEARNVAGFVSQIVRYVASGYFFYVRVVVPEGKDPNVIDAKLMKLYGVGGKRWRRERRNLKQTAGVHYLRCNRCAVLMLTKGKHEAFYRDHGENVRDIRREALKVFGYSIRYGFSEVKKDWKVSVRLDQETYRKVREHMLAISVWDSYREPSRLEREFRRLPYQPYEPVFKQLLSVLRAVNRQRRRRGFGPIGECLRNKLRLGKVFVEDEVECGAVEQGLSA